MQPSLKEATIWMDGRLGFYGILSTQIVEAIKCQVDFKCRKGDELPRNGPPRSMRNLLLLLLLLQVTMSAEDQAFCSMSSVES